MSRIGKKPVEIPEGVTASVDGQTVTAKGPKGELQAQLVDLVTVKHEDNEIIVAPIDQSKPAIDNVSPSESQRSGTTFFAPCMP